jgi:hypothetical protein
MPKEEKSNFEKIETWFQKWFHNQPGFSDVAIVQERLHNAKMELHAVFPEPVEDVKEAPLKKIK